MEQKITHKAEMDSGNIDLDIKLEKEISEIDNLNNALFQLKENLTIDNKRQEEKSKAVIASDSLANYTFKSRGFKNNKMLNLWSIKRPINLYNQINSTFNFTKQRTSYTHTFNQKVKAAILLKRGILPQWFKKNMK
ncbi:MAG: hypothetical protein KAG84_00110 [Bacteroidales bacterium]|nr:hypothetical protein [Bacteroidales bacterium]